MRNRDAGLIGAALVALAAIGWSQWSRTTPKPTSARSEVASEAAVNAAVENADLENVKQQLARLQAEVSAARAQASSAQTPTVVAEPSAEAPPDQPSLEEQELAWQQHTAELGRAFQQEPTNREWASAMRDKISTAAARLDKGDASLVRDIECRSRTCKLELKDGGTVPLGRAVMRLIHELGPDLPNATIAHNGDLTEPKPSAVFLAVANPDDDTPLVARK
jgi:hypothetical protein